MAKAPKIGSPALSAKNIYKNIVAERSELQQEFLQLERAFQAITCFPKFQQRIWLLRLVPYFGIPGSAFIRLIDAYLVDNIAGGEK